MYKRDGITIDMWGTRRFTPKKYRADAAFYPHGSFGFCYRGNIYDDTGECIDDYAANDSVAIENNFQIQWRG